MLNHRSTSSHQDFTNLKLLQKGLQKFHRSEIQTLGTTYLQLSYELRSQLTPDLILEHTQIPNENYSDFLNRTIDLKLIFTHENKQLEVKKLLAHSLKTS